MRPVLAAGLGVIALGLTAAPSFALSRAFLKVERGTVEGYVNVLGTREVVTLEATAHSFQQGRQPSHRG